MGSKCASTSKSSRKKRDFKDQAKNTHHHFRLSFWFNLLEKLISTFLIPNYDEY